jgi:2-haloalkanoic acid dehalogenase type II
MLNTPSVRALLAQPGAPDEQGLLAAFSPNEVRVQAATPGIVYDDVLTQAFADTARDLGLQASEADAKAFGDSVPSWPDFPDSGDALKRLHDMGLKLVIHSNVHNAGFAESRKKLEKGFEFDQVFTAENIGSYKPDQRNFEYSIRRLKELYGIERDEILVTANSKLHDHEPGHIAGLKGAWISRPGANMGVKKFAHIVPDWEFPTMKDFADAMEAARA